MYDVQLAMSTARLWRAGKMIGGDEDEVRNALLAYIERLEAVIDEDQLKQIREAINGTAVSAAATPTPSPE